MKKRIAILGSTGSIGVQALEVISNNTDLFEVDVLTANSSTELLIAQAKQFEPNIVIIADETKYNEISNALKSLPIKVFAGADSIAQVVESSEIDIVLTAMVGYAGLLPTINAIKAGKTIALANKETLVVAGELIKDLALQNNAQIIPVDSEHSAIFQCLVGEVNNNIEKIILTASGGPFRGKDKTFLAKVTRGQALKHPNWAMGNKITIDSATLMNKGLEVIEAKWLFDIKPEQIDVIVHPQSIVHSLVQFEDGSLKAQLGLPDMKLPIQYAFGFPERIKNKFDRFNFIDYPELTFEQPDKENFTCLQIAYDALDKGGNTACVMNAANEVLVDAFLNNKVGFLQIPEYIQETIIKSNFIAKPSLDDYINSNKLAREITQNLIKSTK